MAASGNILLARLRKDLAAAAQRVYDAWEQDEEGNDEEYGGGGICHDIADAMVEVLGQHGIDAQSVSQLIGDVHVYVVAKTDDGVYSVDIPPNTYERGSAYTWQKIPGIKFAESDVDISLIDRDPNKFDNYIEHSLSKFKGWLRWVESCGSFMIRRSWPDLIASEMEPPKNPTWRKTRQGRRRSK